MIKLNKILCPMDLSENSAHALPYAVELAKTYNATLYLLHVVDAYWLESLAMAQLPDYSTKSFNHPAETTSGELQIIKAGIQDVEVETTEVFGTPYVEIVRFARQQDIDLIVLSTHGRTGLKHALIGSDAEKVVQMAPCPVLTIKHPEREFVLP